MDDTERAAKIYFDYKTGDPISDADLEFMINYLVNITSFLFKLGDRFYFPWRDLRGIMDNLEGFQWQRNHYRDIPPTISQK